jgi:hypothetical protein
MFDLNKNFDIIPIPGFTKNNNLDTAKIIRKHKSNVGFTNVRDHLENKKIVLSNISPELQTLYGDLLLDHDQWKNKIESLETIGFQNRLLLSDVEKFQRELCERTQVLESQNEEVLGQNKELLNKNDELLGMNRYLVAQAKEAEEEKRVILEKRMRRQNAKKQPKRDYISPEECYEIVNQLVFKCQDSRYIIARQRIAFFIMYFTGLRVSNLLVLKRIHLQELINNSHTEILLIKGGRSNQ